MKNMKNIEIVSSVAKLLIKNGNGYRNDLCYGSGIVNFEDVLKFEVFELHNIDILDTCRRLYGLKLDLRKKRTSVQMVMDYFFSYFKTKKIYALWLSTHDAVKLLYDGENGITQYKLNKKTLIASDLGADGVLFISDELFLSIN